jgi:N6-L-threonylcarbamoyladenine synthase
MTQATGRDLTVLGIESSCDDTAAAVVRRCSGRPEVLASVVLGQASLHAPFGGVVPEIAARAHSERLDLAVEQALEAAGLDLRAMDAIAVTAGPGLIGGLVAGTVTARALAAATGLSLVGVNHLAGHALSPQLAGPLGFPYLLLLVSGGHCQFLTVRGSDRFQRLGGTIDDAPGEAFDKVAKILGLPQPGGPAVEAEARQGDAGRFRLPRPLIDRDGLDLSFSGLKTAVLRERDRLAAAPGGLRRADRADLCAGFQAAVAEVLAAKAERAIRVYSAENEGKRVFCVAGGVASNATRRRELQRVAEAAGCRFLAPPLALCTDNAAMIAWAGMALIDRGSGGSFAARPRWPLDEDSAPMLGSGKRGAKA